MISRLVARARIRLLANAIAAEAVRGLGVGMGGLVLLLVLGTGILGWRCIWLIPSIAFTAGVLHACLQRPSAYGIARRIDSRLRLDDVLSTAVFFQTEAPARRSDAGVRLAQRYRAMEVAAHIDLARALPLRIPRGIWGTAALLALLAAGLVTLRSHYEGRLDLRRPATAALFELMREAKAQALLVRSRIEMLVSRPEARTAGAEERDAAGEGTAARADQNEPGRNAMEKRDRQDTIENRRNTENPAANRTAASNQQDTDSQSERSRGDRSDSESRLLSTLHNGIENLMSALRPDSGRGQSAQKGSKSGSKGGKQKAEAGSASRQEAEQAGADGAAGTGDPDEVHAGDTTIGQGSDGKNPESPGMGAGRQNGNKAIRSAQDLEAMAKIRELAGRRSNDVTGTAYIELQSGRQTLKTAYEPLSAQRSAAQQSTSRDQVPTVLRDYVQHYFGEIRQTRPARATARRSVRYWKSPRK